LIMNNGENLRELIRASEGKLRFQLKSINLT
jgi:hypothetical protein